MPGDSGILQKGLYIVGRRMLTPTSLLDSPQSEEDKLYNSALVDCVE